MKIGIEAQRVFRKKKHGMDMVALELIRHLQQLDKENEYFVFVRPDEDKDVLQETPNFKIVEVEGASYPAWEQLSLPAAASRFGCDLLHCTSNTAPLATSIPLVVTLHDIIYMESSYARLLLGEGSNYQKFGNAYRKMVVPRIVRKARRILTVSGFEERQIANFFQLPPDGRLAAIHNGASDHFRPITDPAELDRVKAKYRLPERFFFFLGNTDPKKNTPGTLKAFSEYVRATGADTKLVMIDFGEAELKKMLSAIGDPGLIDRIVLTGYIDNRDLPAIYSQCQLFLYPSLRESFGIPIVEAMACGAPVITSDTSSMPEVGGGAVVLVDPQKPASIAQAMIQVERDAARRQSMIRQGRLQAAQFSWGAMAEKVLKHYRAVYEEARLSKESIR